MPKAGSQTVEATLERCSLPYQIRRFHYLSKRTADDIRRCLEEKGTVASWQHSARNQLKLLSDLSWCLRVRRLLCACGLPLPKLLVITAVRDVIGAALSSIFQNYRLFVSEPSLLTPDKCQELLLRPKLCAQFQDWFDAELRPQIGVDVYRTPFPTQDGFCVYETRFARVLLYRFETLPRLAPVLEGFLGCKVPELSSRNLGDSKEYAPTYHRVTQSLNLTAEFVRSQHAGKLMRHFYSPEELRSRELKWCGQLQSR